jgi:hypothetical protein
VLRTAEACFDLGGYGISNIAELMREMVRLFFNRAIRATPGIFDAGVEDDLGHGHPARRVPCHRSPGRVPIPIDDEAMSGGKALEKQHVTAREGSNQSFLGVDIVGDAQWQGNRMR